MEQNTSRRVLLTLETSLVAHIDLRNLQRSILVFSTPAILQRNYPGAARDYPKASAAYIPQVIGRALLVAHTRHRFVSKPHARPRGGRPGSFDLVAVHEVGAHLEVGGQVEHQVLQGWVLEEFGLGQGRLAPGAVLAAPEGAVEVEHHVAEHVAQQQQAQEVVAEELEVGGVWKTRFGDANGSLMCRF